VDRVLHQGVPDDKEALVEQVVGTEQTTRERAKQVKLMKVEGYKVKLTCIVCTSTMLCNNAACMRAYAN
jgi:hypothetical protein